MRLRFPFATLVLTACLVCVYFFLSQGLLYIDSGTLAGYSFGSGTPFYSVFTHLFVHVGINHLVGNVVPFIIFGLILEPLLGGWLVLAVFLVAGVVSSALFASVNPGYSLIGASAGVSGIIGAAAISRPRASLLMLLVLPALLYAVVFPLVHHAIDCSESQLAKREFDLEMTAAQLNASGRPGDALVVVGQAQEAQEQLIVSTDGRQREAATPSDLLVHVAGAVVGIAAVILLRRDLVERGTIEFADFGERVSRLILRK